MLPPVVARLVGDNTQYVSSLREAERATKGSTDKSSGHFRKLGGAMGAAMKVGAAAGIAATGVFVTKAVGAASDLAESLSKSNTIFGEQAKAVESWASKASSSMGLSKQAALESASTFGNMFIQLGIGRDKATDMSKSMVGLATDFASFHNASQPEALEAMSAAFRGEYDAVQRFVPTINAAAVEQKALAMGLKGTTKELTAQDKALATQALLMEGAGAATGDYARTSEGFANKMREFKAKAEDFKASVGAAVIPVLLKLFDLGERLGGLASGPISAFFGTVKAIVFDFVTAFKLALSGEAFDAMTGPQRVAQDIVVAVQGVVAFVQENWPKIQATIASVMEAVVAIVSGVVGLVTVIWNNFGEQIVSYTQSAFQNAMTIIGGVMNVIQGVIATVTAIIHGDWSAAWDGIKQVVGGAWQVIQGLVQQAMNIMRTIVSIGMEILASVVRSAFEGVVGFVSSIPGRIRGALGNMGGLLYGAGQDLLQGMINGLRSMAGRLIDAALAPVRSAVNAVKGFLGIRSPSTLAYSMAMDVGRGWVKGLHASEKMVATAARDAWVNSLSDAQRAAISQAQGFGQHNISATGGYRAYVNPKTGEQYYAKSPKSSGDVLAGSVDREAWIGAMSHDQRAAMSQAQGFGQHNISASGGYKAYINPRTGEQYYATGPKNPGDRLAGAGAPPPDDDSFASNSYYSGGPRPGAFQNEDGSWDAPVGGSAISGRSAGVGAGGGNSYTVNVYTATGDIPAETIRKIRAALFELGNDVPATSIVPA